ncbi:hypothetical protein FDECE_14463, partial [Fusarium decemcellulare]
HGSVQEEAVPVRGFIGHRRACECMDCDFMARVTGEGQQFSSAVWEIGVGDHQPLVTMIPSDCGCYEMNFAAASCTYSRVSVRVFEFLQQALGPVRDSETGLLGAAPWPEPAYRRAEIPAAASCRELAASNPAPARLPAPTGLEHETAVFYVHYNSSDSGMTPDTGSRVWRRAANSEWRLRRAPSGASRPTDPEKERGLQTTSRLTKHRLRTHDRTSLSRCPPRPQGRRRQAARRRPERPGDRHRQLRDCRGQRVHHLSRAVSPISATQELSGSGLVSSPAPVWDQALILASSKAKSFLASPHERLEWRRSGFVATVKWLWNVRDEDTIKKCGLDAYFFLRYLQTLLAIFVPIAVVVIPVLVPVNYIGGRGSQLNSDAGNSTDDGSPGRTTGLDTLAWGNVRPTSTHRYWAHLSMSLVVVAWVCFVFFHEMKRYVEVRQSYLTSAEHRARPSARTILVNSIPVSLRSREKLERLFFLFPGGVENVWINRDFSSLTEKIDRRDAIHRKLEEAETALIKAVHRAWKKAGKPVSGPEGVGSQYQRSKSAPRRRSPLWSLLGGRAPRAPGPSCRDSEKTDGLSLGHPGGGSNKPGEAWPWSHLVGRDDRPSHRLPLFGSRWLPGVAPFSRRVDTIDWCREQLDTLNAEIEQLQGSPEDRFPLLDSAF